MKILSDLARWLKSYCPSKKKVFVRGYEIMGTNTCLTSPREISMCFTLFPAEEVDDRARTLQTALGKDWTIWTVPTNKFIYSTH